MNKKRVYPEFKDPMTKLQRVGGYIYLPIHIAILPILVGMIDVFFPGTIDGLSANLAYFIIGFLFCMIFERKYLRDGFDKLLDNKGRNIIALLVALFIYFFLSFIVNASLLAILGDKVLNNPNNEGITELAKGNVGMVMGMAVFLGPIVEEVLFRGVIFGSLHKKNRILAYIISIVLFSVCHVWQYALGSMDPTMFIFALQYVPIAYALTWLYENTNCIWLPIFVHMLMNWISMTVIS